MELLAAEEDVLAEAETLMKGGDATLPLYGIPVAIKDNIPVEGEAMRSGSAATSGSALGWSGSS